MLDCNERQISCELNVDVLRTCLKCQVEKYQLSRQVTSTELQLA